MFKDSPPETRAHPPALDPALRREAVHYARALGCKPDLADDVTQEAYLSLWQAGLLLDRPAPLVRAALRTAVRFRMLDAHRQQSKDRSVQDEAWADAVDKAWQASGPGDDHNRWLEALRGCRAKLRGRVQQVAGLFYDEQLSREEVAARLGMKETGVKTLLQRLRATLRQCIERSLR